MGWPTHLGSYCNGDGGPDGSFGTVSDRELLGPAGTGAVGGATGLAADGAGGLDVGLGLSGSPNVKCTDERRNEGRCV